MFPLWLSTDVPHVTVAFAASLSLCVLTLGFTSRTSPLRSFGMVLVLGCLFLAWRSVRTTQTNTHQFYTSFLMGSTSSMMLQYLDSALLSCWTYETRGPTSGLGGQTALRTPNENASHLGWKPRSITKVDRLVFGLEETFRARSAGTRWEVKHVPKFFPDQPNIIPTRRAYLIRAMRRCLLSLLVVDVISFMGRDASMNAINFAPSRVPFFALLQAMYDASAIVVIGLGLGRIERWPPLFGSWTECWSIRQFWGYIYSFDIPRTISRRHMALITFSAFSGIKGHARNSWLQPISSLSLCFGYPMGQC